MAYDKKGPSKKGQRGAYYNKRGNKQFKNNQKEHRRYADKNQFDSSNIYSMMPPSRPPKKRRNYKFGSMEGIVETNARYKGAGKSQYGKKNFDKHNAQTHGNSFYEKQKGDFSKHARKKESFPQKNSFKSDSKKSFKNKPYSDKPFYENNTHLDDGELIAGRNPVKEAIKSGRDLEKLLVQKNATGSAKQILSLAKDAGVRVQMVEKSHLDKLAKNHQGMVAFASAYKYAEVEDILNNAREKNEKPFIVLLDQITDPHNLGAIIRSSVCTGAHGVIIPLHRSAGLTNSAVKAAAGAIEYIPVARVTNLVQTINELKRQNIWVYGMDMAGKPYSEADFASGTAIVIGSEGTGLSKSVREACDDVLSIPMTGEIGSFNASVAAGIIMHHVFISR